MQQEQRTLRETFEATPRAVPEARHLLVAFAQRYCPGAPQIIDAVALAVSEAVANVVRHAYPEDTGKVELCAAADEQSLRITITDHGVGRATASRNPGEGLGLTIMREMAEAQIHDLPSGVQVALRFPCTDG
jgi:serine/threonine-protein kinase RsbW